MTKSSTEVAKVEHATFAIAGMPKNEMIDLVRSNLGIGSGVTMFDLDRIKVPAGGGTFFELPTIDGDSEVMKEVIGVPLAYRDPRGYWPTDYDEGGGSPPQCSSPDGVNGYGDPGGPCAECPLAQFGSARKGDKELRGQACKQMRAILFLRENDILPMIVSVPPTSLKEMRRFFLRLASHRKRFNQIVLKIKLAETKNDDGVKYSHMIPSVHRFLTDEEGQLIEEYAAQVSPVFQKVAVEPDDYSK